MTQVVAASVAPVFAEANTATAIVCDRSTHRVLSAHGDVAAFSNPGSVVKPFILDALLKRGLTGPGERLVCSGHLRVAGHALPCSHLPSVEPFDATDALAASCNSWFAAMAPRLGANGVAQALAEAGFRVEKTSGRDRAILQALGIDGVRTSPERLAISYARLYAGSPGAAVLAGLCAAVERGTAQSARSARIALAGKTGTCISATGRSTDGWFAGWSVDAARGIVIAVRWRGANGAAAAARARELAEAWASGTLR